MHLRRAFYPLLGFTLLGAILLAWLVYHSAFRANIRSDQPYYELLIRKNATWDSIQPILDTILINKTSFYTLRNFIRLHHLKEGRYVLRPDMDNVCILRKLRSGDQDPIRLTINNVRDVPQLCGKMGGQLMLDSLSLLNFLNDTLNYSHLGFTSQTILCAFIPNTYQVYWTVSAEKLLERMIQEKDLFWSKKDRLEKARALNLDPVQVYTLASIVEKETNVEQEKGLISGVYLNRLKSGMKLQADPTVVYALGVQGLQRVLHEHLIVDSPYNTYMYEGLPPGPIWMPSTSTLDSVLNAAPHNYLFFCAKPGYDGSHAFSESIDAHYQCARIYRQWLNQQHIR